jgi:hypothetical protein
MKTLLTLILFSLFANLNGQLDSTILSAIPTTMEEYNYLIKGYKIQVESGLDMKKGYYFNEIGEHQIGAYHFTIKNLVREDPDELAGILIITHSGTSGRTYYTGIPIQNPELMKLYTADVAKWDGGMTAAYCHLISSYLSADFYADHKSGIRK